MKNFSYVIKDEIGIHARPAGLLVKEAGKFQSAITIKANGKSGDAKRIFGIMGMAVKQNDEVTVEADGADEAEAIAGLKKFFEENL
jgi:phosphocarrier protein HPr